MGKKPERKPLTNSQQVEALQRLGQGAAAWLIGVASRTIRDFVEIPRGENGVYDARDLLKFAVDRASPPELTDDELETAIQIADWLHDHDGEEPLRTISILEFTDQLVSRRGPLAALAFFDAIRDRWLERTEETRQELDELNRSPTEDELRARFQEEREHHELRRRLARFEVTYQCDTCKRVRRGGRWEKSRPLGGHHVIGDICPKCAARI